MLPLNLGLVDSRENFDDASGRRLLPGVEDAVGEHEVEARHREEKHLRLSRRCGFFVYFLGIPAGTLAIAAGSAALAEAPTWVTATIAFLSAAFTTAMTLVAPVEARDHNLRRANEYADFRRRLRCVRIELSQTTDYSTQLAALRELDQLRLALDDSTILPAAGAGGETPRLAPAEGPDTSSG
jgi:hypothetical protein